MIEAVLGPINKYPEAAIGVAVFFVVLAIINAVSRSRSK